MAALISNRMAALNSIMAALIFINAAFIVIKATPRSIELAPPAITKSASNTISAFIITQFLSQLKYLICQRN